MPKAPTKRVTKKSPKAAADAAPHAAPAPPPHETSDAKAPATSRREMKLEPPTHPVEANQEEEPLRPSDVSAGAPSGGSMNIAKLQAMA
ncbi:MAG: hypothetical protein ABSA47_17025, partial [Verrucomicrobiota bacterium]